VVVSRRDDLLEVHDPRFAALVPEGATLERLNTGCRWAEGPVYFPDTEWLLWSDVVNDRLMRWVPGLGAGVMRERCGFHNGHTRDAQGRLISCEHGARRVTRVEPDGRLTVLAHQHAGRRLNSPNDVVVRREDGSIWFTDPDYGILSDDEGHRADSEQDGCHVYRIDPLRGTVEPVVTDMAKPNGLAFSPDGRWLYVADSGGSHIEGGPHHIRRFAVDSNGRVRDAGLLAEVQPGMPDGIKTDVDGRVWSSAADGVHCFDPEGRLLGKLRVPEIVANLCFGGPDRTRLFVTATTSLYSIDLAVPGP
jgi:gluconolactonase